MKDDIEFDMAADRARMATVAAEFAQRFLFPRHRGALDCDDRFVVFGNDGYDDDPRSRREVEIVLEALKQDDPSFGVSPDGYSWAVVVTDYQRQKFDIERLERIVWDARMAACDEVVTESR